MAENPKPPSANDLHSGLVHSEKPSGLNDSTFLSNVFSYHGVHVNLIYSQDGLRWRPTKNLTSCFGLCRPQEGTVQLEDIIAVKVTERLTRWNDILLKLTSSLDIHTFRHSKKSYQELRSAALRFKTDNIELTQRWAEVLQGALQRLPDRPRKLKVFVNPFGGKRQAPIVWKLTAEPLFKLAGIHYDLINTERAQHAEHVVANLTKQELEDYDGVVAIGGDGLFHELVNGILTLRAVGDDRQGLAGTFRLGHIPAGSTDTVAYTIHGTRSTQTAAMRIVLGDRMPIDIARLDMMRGQRHTFAVSMIAYGYMGDLIKESELWRSLGPLRYEYVGVKVLLRSRTYKAKVSYQTPDAYDPTEEHSDHAQYGVCVANCMKCLAAQTSPSSTPFTRPGRRVSLLDQAAAQGWHMVEDEFRSIMIVIIPCRSNKSIHGVVPFSHLADGTLHLVLVRKCSNLQYVRFLLSINRQGLRPNMFDFVSIIPVTTVEVRPQGRESSWNCDGELLPENHIQVRAQKGLIQVAARGVVERMPRVGSQSLEMAPPQRSHSASSQHSGVIFSKGIKQAS